VKDREKTLWIVKQNAISPDQAGGTRQFDLARELARRGWQVVLWASSFSYLEHRDVKLASGESWKIEEFDGVRIVWLKSYPYERNNWKRILNMLDFAGRLYRRGRTIRKRIREIPPPQAVIAFSVPLLAPLAAYFVAKSYRAKFFMEVGDLWPQTLIDMGVLGERHPLTVILRALEKFLYRRSQRVIVSLPRAGEYLENLGIESRKIVYIPNGVDLRRFADVSAETIARPPDGPFTAMYLGAHGPANALDTLLAAAKILQQTGDRTIRLVLIGDGQEKPRLQKLAQTWRLENVEFRDPIPQERVPRALAEADVLIFHLKRANVFRYGISSNKLFDYMASGRPVISAVEPSNNPVKEARCGLTIPPQEPKALAEAILRLSNMSKEERAAMGRRGRAYVEKHHSIPVLADKLIHCLEEARPAA
jgi:glycosyltransferase involved in cell wall biosynthesis